jgi:hypothetical protein
MFREHKVPRPYSDALPIYRKSGAQMGPDCASSLTGARDDEFLKIRLFYFPLIHPDPRIFPEELLAEFLNICSRSQGRTGAHF